MAAIYGEVPGQRRRLEWQLALLWLFVPRFLMPLLPGNEGRGTAGASQGSNACSGYSPGHLTWKRPWPTLHFLTRLGARSFKRTRWVAANNYTVEFPAGMSMAGRVLWPNGPAEPLSRLTASDR